MILPWWVKPLAVLLLLAGAAFGGWQARVTWDKAEERDRLAGVITSMQLDQQEARAMSEDLQKSLANLKPTFTTIRNEVQREIIEKPVYLNPDCRLPDSGRLRLDAAINAANAAGRLDYNLPRPAPAGRELTR